MKERLISKWFSTHLRDLIKFKCSDPVISCKLKPAGCLTHPEISESWHSSCTSSLWTPKPQTAVICCICSGLAESRQSTIVVCIPLTGMQEQILSVNSSSAPDELQEQECWMTMAISSIIRIWISFIYSEVTCQTESLKLFKCSKLPN